MIELRNISIGYKGLVLLSGASLGIGRGEVAALVGRNGAGKSTLLRAMAGLGEVRGGEILIGGEPLQRMSAQRLAERVAVVTTERVRVPNLRCRDVVALGRAPYTNWIGRMQREDALTVAKSLAQVGMESYAERTMESLSDGECQRIMIARALAQQTPVILLDEPTSFLDLPNRYEICTLLRELAHGEGKTILYSTHELDIALSLCDSVVVADPPVLHHLPAAEVGSSGLLERIFGLAKQAEENRFHLAGSLETEGRRE